MDNCNSFALKNRTVSKIGSVRFIFFEVVIAIRIHLTEKNHSPLRNRNFNSSPNLNCKWALRVHSHLQFIRYELSSTCNCKQECIPAGCVPSAAVAVCWGVYLVPGGVPGPGGCTWSGGVPVPGGVPGPGGYLPC